MKRLLFVPGLILTIILTYSCEEKPVPPSISTNIVTEISTTTAVSGGNITANGGAPIISKGICWNTSENPTIDNNKTIENADLVSFTSNITQLTPNTSYYVRAYATNSAGIGYGKSESFKTLGDKPGLGALSTSNITINSAILTGSVNPNFLSTTVIFEYGPTPNYGSTITALESPVSGDLGENVTVKADLSGLAPGKTYHFRIKAENSLGITYSSSLTFTTLGQAPTVLAPTTTNLKVNTVTLNGSVNANYLSTTVTFEWGTTTGYGNSITALQSPLTGNTSIAINADLSGLIPETTYHFRISATNELGTTNSDDLEFTTYTVEDADKNLYHSVTIGTQTWMKENLKTTHLNNNIDISKITDNTEWSNLTAPAYSWYNNDELVNKNIYGALYNWYSVNTGNLCPAGWHVPSLEEWHTLVTYLGGDSIADENLRERGTIHWIFDTGANNNTGFTLLPAGNREADGRFFNLGLSAHLWSSFEDYENAVQRCWNIGLEWHISKIYWTPYSSKFGASVRCLKD